MTRIVISGIRGRMGQTLLQLARERSDIEVTGGIAREAGTEADSEAGTDAGPTVARPSKPGLPDAGLAVRALEDAHDLIGECDVVIDFSTAAATAKLIEKSGDALAGRAIVIGTTGLDADTARQLDALASRAAVLTAANFSPGVNLLLGLTERVSAALDATSYDIEIVEAHHRRKVDAPSGTAIALGEAAARGRRVNLHEVRRDGRSGETGTRPDGEIGFHAVRGGGTIGEHRVQFAGERERIELVHEALDRSVFAQGALTAARWIAGREPGRYTMLDVLGL